MTARTPWTDPTWQQLTTSEQHTFMLLSQQPDVTRCGTLTLALVRRARLTSDITPETLLGNLKALHAAGWVVLDEDYEEVMFCGHVERDGILSMPLVVVSMIREYEKISSPTIKAALVAELHALWFSEQATDKQRAGLTLAFLGEHDNEKACAALKATGTLPRPPHDPLAAPPVTVCETPGKTSMVPGLSAASGDGAAAEDPLDLIQRLKDDLARSSLRALWVKTTQDQRDEIVMHIRRCGIPALTAAAKAQHNGKDPARYVNAWLEAWRDVPSLPERLRVVS